MTQVNRSVLVTGGTGLVGSHLLFELTSDGKRPKALFRTDGRRDFTRRVFNYYSDKADELFQSIEWVKADILDFNSVADAARASDQVYHCAATVSFDSSQNESVIRNNTLGTANIVKACLQSTRIKLCHVSSTAALGSTGKGVLTDETNIWADTTRNSAYAVSKYLSEQEVWKGINQDLCAVIVNPSIIFGPGDWRKGSSSYFSNIARGLAFYTRGVTGYVDVRDVVKSMMMLMESPIKGERFIISSENLSFQEVFNMIAKSIGAKKPFIPVPKALSYPALLAVRLSGFITGKKSAITSEIMRAAYSRIYFDNSKIIRTTGISFIPICKSIEDTVMHYKSDLRLRPPKL